MVLLNYVPSTIETMISSLYVKKRILNPHDLDMHRIADCFDIELVFSDHRCYAYSDDSIKIININYGIPKQEQKEIFYHELCHILLHAGVQYQKIPKLFLDLQEREAKYFVKYAAIPYHMLRKTDIQSSIHELAERFSISEKIARQRLEHIYRNRVVQLHK